MTPPPGGTAAPPASFVTTHICLFVRCCAPSRERVRNIFSSISISNFSFAHVHAPTPLPLHTGLALPLLPFTYRLTDCLTNALSLAGSCCKSASAQVFAVRLCEFQARMEAFIYAHPHTQRY